MVQLTIFALVILSFSVLGVTRNIQSVYFIFIAKYCEMNF